VLRKLIIAVVAAGTSAVTWAASPADVVIARQNNFKQLGRAQKSIADELKTSSPNLNTIRTSANALANLAPQLSRWFPARSGRESGARTGALPAIWQQPGRFNQSAIQLTTAARGLQRAAVGGNALQIRAALVAVGGACKSCHDEFKGDK
jgi:cytochrome c556